MKIRKLPNLNKNDIIKCVPIGLCSSAAHACSVLASGAGAVSFAQIVKACEPVFAAIIGVIVPPSEVKPVLAYVMLVLIVAGVGLACVKDGETTISLNMVVFGFASAANLAASFKGKLGHSVTHSLKVDKSKNMDSANVYAVMNMIAFCWCVPMVVINELPTLSQEWEHAVEIHGLVPLVTNIAASGFFYYIYNEFAFAFTSNVGPVTSSVLNTAKRVIIIVVSAVMFNEGLGRNKIVGSAIAILGTFLYSYFSTKKAEAVKSKRE